MDGRLQSITMATVCLLLITNRLVVVVDAKAPPTIIESSYQKRHVVREGDPNLRLLCPVESNPPPLIAWLKDSDTIHLGWDRYQIRGEKLIIKNVEKSDSGVFICRATNGFGTVDVKFLVYVYDETNDTTLPPDEFEEDIFAKSNDDEDPPVFLDLIEMRPQVSLHAGSSISLNCKLSGRPWPEITWYKDGSKMTLADVDLVKNEAAGEDDEVTGISTLRLSQVQDGDSGRYMCVAVNRAGSVNYTYTVRVIADTMISDENHGFIMQHPKNVTAVVGETASFQCHIRSETMPRIQWLRRVDPTTDLRNSSGARVTMYNTPFIVLEGGQTVARNDGTYLNKFLIQSISEQDAGMYYCTNSDSQGFGYRIAFLTVLPGIPRGQSTHETESKSTLDSSFLPIILAILIIGIVVFFIVILFIVCRHRAKKRSLPSSASCPPSIASLHRPLPVKSTSVTASPASVAAANGSLDKRLADHHYETLEATPGGATDRRTSASCRDHQIMLVKGGRGESTLSDRSSMFDTSTSSPLHQTLLAQNQHLLHKQYQQQQQHQLLLLQREQQQLLQQQQQQLQLQQHFNQQQHEPYNGNCPRKKYDSIVYC